MKPIFEKALALALCVSMTMALSSWSGIATAETQNAAEEAASAGASANTQMQTADVPSESDTDGAGTAAAPTTLTPTAAEALTPASDKDLTVTVDGVDISTCQLPDLLVGYTDPHRAYVSIRNNDPWYDSGTLNCYFTSDDSEAFIPQQIDIQGIAPSTAEGFYVSAVTGLARGSYDSWLILWPGVLHDIEFRVNVWDILPTPSNLSWEASYPTHAQWNVAEGGSGATLQLFKDGTADANKVGDPVTVGAGVQSYDFSALMGQYGSGTYYFKALGLGSEDNLYRDSAWSEASAGTNYLTDLHTANNEYTVSGDHTGWIPTDMSVVNSGKAASGQVNLTISGTDASVFTLDSASIANIAAGGNWAVKIGVKEGTLPGTYQAKLTVSSEGCNDWVVDLTAHMDRLEVSPDSLSWTLAKNFDPSMASKVATVYNNAGSASGTITAALSGDDASSFTLDTTSLRTIAAGSSGVFSVTPAAGLSVGTHTATLTIYENGTKLKEVPLSATIGDYLQPGTPENLAWSTTSPGLLSWAASDYATGYRYVLYRYEGSEPVVVSRGDTAATSFDFLSLMQKNGAAKYFVELRAYNDDAESAHDGSSAQYNYPPTYTVRFDAADGTGSMADEVMVYGTAKNLAVCSFSRAGYTFAGWATAKGGSRAYADGASVENLATADGAIVTLYAVWVPYTQTKTLENGVVITLTGSTKTIDQLVVKRHSPASDIIMNTLGNRVLQSDWDIYFTDGTTEDFGTLTLTFPATGDTVQIWEVHNGTLTKGADQQVANGMATVTVTTLSEFAVTAASASTTSASIPNTADETPRALLACLIIAGAALVGAGRARRE